MTNKQMSRFLDDFYKFYGVNCKLTDPTNLGI
jgi:hypothetical protein